MTSDDITIRDSHGKISHRRRPQRGRISGERDGNNRCSYDVCSCKHPIAVVLPCRGRHSLMAEQGLVVIKSPADHGWRALELDEKVLLMKAYLRREDSKELLH